MVCIDHGIDTSVNAVLGFALLLASDTSFELHWTRCDT